MSETRPVLAVDDEYYITRAISYLLQEDGIKCISKNDTDGVLALIEKEHPLVIVLDINMPLLDGFSLCSEIRSRKEFEDTVIFMLTARGQEDDVKRGIGCGANEYILKPFNPIELRDKIKAVYASKAT